MDGERIETAEQASAQGDSIVGALKSASSNQERAKRASAVRFADQINVEDEGMAKMQSSLEGEVIRESVLSARENDSPMDRK